MAQTALSDFLVRQSSRTQPEHPDIAVHKDVHAVDKYPNTWVGRLNKKFAASKVGFVLRSTITPAASFLIKLPSRAAGPLL
jgi:hypothetical protein